MLRRILTELNFCFMIETLAQTGEEIAIANANSGKVCGYIRNDIFVYIKNTFYRSKSYCEGSITQTTKDYLHRNLIMKSKVQQ